MTTSLENSLRCSKISHKSFIGGKLNDTYDGENINDQYMQERDSITLDTRVEELKSHKRMAKTIQKLSDKE